MDENKLHKTCRKQKNKIVGKIMFLTALPRPKFDNEENETISRKIDIFLCVCRIDKKKYCQQSCGSNINEIYNLCKKRGE